MTRALTLIPLVGVLFGCWGEPILDPGVPVTRAIAVDDSHLYRIALQAGDFLELDLDQDGDNLQLALEAPDRSQILKVDTPNGPFGRERLFAVAEVSGEHWVTVALNGHVGGSYTLRAEVWRASEEDRRRALACRLLYESWFAGDTSPEAQAAGEKALALWDELDEPYLATVALVRLGRLYAENGEHDEAVRYFRQARERLASLEPRDLEPEVLVQLASVLSRTKPDAAREIYEKALTASRNQRDRWHVGAALNGLGILLYDNRRQPWLALGLFDQALDIFGQLRDVKSQANAHFNRGLVFNWLGREEPALVEYDAALALRESLGLPDRALSEILLEIGWAHMWQGEEQETEQEILAALSKAGDEDREQQAICLDRLGTLYGRQERLEEARDAYLAVLERLDDGAELYRAHTLSNLGRTYGDLGETARALERLDQALGIFERLGNRSGVAYTRVNRARVLRRLGNLHAAQKELETALELHERLRDETRSSGFRASYMDTVSGHFQLYVDLLMDLETVEPGRGWAVRALEAVEKSRARSLLELVTQLGAERQREIGQSALVADREPLLREVEALEAEVRGLRAVRAPQEEIEEKSRHLGRLAANLEYLEGVAATPLTEPRKLEQIRQELDPDTSLLVYALGETRGFVWLVGREGVLGWKQLGSRDELATQTRPLVDALREPIQSPSGSSEIEEKLAMWGRELIPAGHLTRRLVVIPDGTLHYLPFGALRIDDRYLAEDHEISRLPSASVLLALRERKKSKASAPNLLAVVADPVLDPGDPRFSPDAAAAAWSSRGDASSGLDFLTRLPESGREADRLVSRVARSRRWEARDFGATRESVRGGLEQASLLHLATHALLHDDLPELSQVVLSRFDSAGRAIQGSLYAFEIAEMDLSADLVVLSACRTALGPEIRGEGLVGLPQSFFEAGADRVVVSLWGVDDTATAELMESFYTGLFVRRLAPPEALRRAQQHLRSSELWSEPYYWAAFTLIGDWRGLPSTLLDSPCLHP